MNKLFFLVGKRRAHGLLELVSHITIDLFPAEANREPSGLKATLARLLGPAIG